MSADPCCVTSKRREIRTLGRLSKHRETVVERLKKSRIGEYTRFSCGTKRILSEPKNVLGVPCWRVAWPGRWCWSGDIPSGMRW